MHIFHFGSKEENVCRTCDLKFNSETILKEHEMRECMLKPTVGLQTTYRAEWRQMYKMPLLPPLTNLTDCCSFVMTLWNKLILYSSCITDWLFRLMIKSFLFSFFLEREKLEMHSGSCPGKCALLLSLSLHGGCIHTGPVIAAHPCTTNRKKNTTIWHQSMVMKLTANCRSACTCWRGETANADFPEVPALTN